MTTKQERSLRAGQARDRLFIALKGQSSVVRVLAYQKLERALLKEAGSATERRELRRRITTDLLRATKAAGWSVFSRHLRRMERLGYVDLDERLLVCVMTAEAGAGSPSGTKTTARLIAEIERRARSVKNSERRLWELNNALARARAFARL